MSMSPQWLEQAAECLRVMAHPARLRMIELLNRQPCSVKEIAAYCSLPHNQACEHLRLMKSHGLLDAERDGQTVYYRLVAPQAMGLLHCLQQNCPEWNTASKKK
ncbi:MAG TPA: metalloregulator ArsR/SmtB family transcription factor [Phycisphaerae bacterium]|nr:metalloregulator ArsR/SmtB family transcription factor [Phycisphaerae bacterium]